MGGGFQTQAGDVFASVSVSDYFFNGRGIQYLREEKPWQMLAAYIGVGGN